MSRQTVLSALKERVAIAENNRTVWMEEARATRSRHVEVQRLLKQTSNELGAALAKVNELNCALRLANQKLQMVDALAQTQREDGDHTLVDFMRIIDHVRG